MIGGGRRPCRRGPCCSARHDHPDHGDQRAGRRRTLVQHLRRLPLHRRDPGLGAALVRDQGPAQHRHPRLARGCRRRRRPRERRGVRLRDRGRGHRRMHRGGPVERGPGGLGLPAGGRTVRRRRRRDPDLEPLDAPAGLRLRLGLPGRAAGEGEQLPASRPGQGARRLLLAQLLHRLLAAGGGAGRVGGRRGDRVGRRQHLALRHQAGEQRRRGCPPRPRRSRPAPRRAPGRSVRDGAARVRRRCRHPDGGLQPGRDRTPGCRLVPDQRRRGRAADVQLTRLPAPGPRAAQPPGAYRLLGQRGRDRRRSWQPPGCATSGRT